MRAVPLFLMFGSREEAAEEESAHIFHFLGTLTVQEFWNAAAYALAAHLQQSGVYGLLTLVHLPGLSVYDEEIRLPTGSPRPTAADTQACPDGRPAYPTIINDADTSRWRSLGYSDSAVINGFKVIASAFAQAFPDRFLGLSLFPPGAKGIDFPNLTSDPVGNVASQIVQEVTAIAPGRIQIQSDNLDANYVEAEVLNLSTQYSDLVGWQSNKHGETGAGCDGGGAGSCNPDGPSSPYFQLLQNGWKNKGKYIEVWSADVVNFPQSFAEAQSSGYYTLTSVELGESVLPLQFTLKQNYPNPYNPSTTIKYNLPTRSHVQLIVYDVLGKVVSDLVDTEQPAGFKSIVWNANVSSGIYFYRLEAASLDNPSEHFIETKKMLLLK